MSSKRDYYEVLGVSREASEGEITSAYRKLAIRFHPDSNPDDPEATTRFKEAAEAYEVLKDGDKRARYDQFGHAGIDGGQGFNSVEDIFETFGNIFSDGIFGDLFGGGDSRQRRRRRGGADVRCDVELTLEEAFAGVNKTVQFHRHEPCEKCQGQGAEPGASKHLCRQCGGHGRVVQSAGILRVQTTCPVCRGSGQIISELCSDCRGEGVRAREVTREVRIPAGVDDGTRVRLEGEGEPGLGGPPGDCYCFVHLSQHRIFHRNGRHLLLEVPISYCQAALGATVEVPTLDGRTDVQVPQGTQSGEVFRLQGQGMPDLRGGPRGDLLVKTYIETPKKLTEKQEELLRELADLEHVHVTPHRKSFLEKIREYLSLDGDEPEPVPAPKRKRKKQR